jgi:hypothetical protein
MGYNQNAGQNFNLKRANGSLENCGKVLKFGNNANKSKVYSRKHYEQFKLKGCLLALSSESSPFPLAIHNRRRLNTKNYNFDSPMDVRLCGSN